MEKTLPEWLKIDMARRAAEKRARAARTGRYLIVAGILAVTALAILLQPYTVSYDRQEWVRPDPCGLQSVICEGEEAPARLPTVHVQSAYAYVTGYNTVPEQTDSTPCIAASGANICGRKDVVACPRSVPLGTKVEISGKTYVCEDRLAEKYDHRYDISCDKDTACPATVTGKKLIKVLAD